MNMRDLIPWTKGESRTPTQYRDVDPFTALHREVNRLFDDVSRSFDQCGLGRFPSLAASSDGWGWPNVEISTTENEIQVTAELPGLEERDVEARREAFRY
jgi:HSP20 family protein